MIEKVNFDERLFEPGTILFAKEHPQVKLRIVSYMQRIYYCERVGHEAGKQLAYFHRELIPPGKAID